VAFFAIMLYVTFVMLKEVKPAREWNSSHIDEHDRLRLTFRCNLGGMCSALAAS
jgi:hypothetical protein